MTSSASDALVTKSESLPVSDEALPAATAAAQASSSSQPVNEPAAGGTRRGPRAAQRCVCHQGGDGAVH
ncbi:hypothetical protein MTO96_004523 [Rhipicephalus appendiculatus]